MSDTAVATATAPSAAPMVHSAWKDPSGFGFRDLIDIVNPLQHLPIISSIYRWLTGDRPGDAAKIAGDALYGGPIGVAVGLVGVMAEDSQGRDLGEHVLAEVFGHDASTASASAQAVPPSAAAPAAAPAAAASPPPSPKLLFGGIALPTSPQAASTAAQPAPAIVQAVPDHPPIPLYGGIAQPTSASRAPAQSTAARDFLAHTATLQRQISSGTRPNVTTTAPVPLELPAGVLPPRRLPTTTAAPASAANRAAPPSPDTPVDIPQKMLDALDKYRKLEQDRKAGATPAAAPAVDVSL